MTSAEHASNPEPERVDWDRYEAELQAQPPAEGEGRVLVDAPEAQRPPRPGLAGLRAAQRRPIVPAWLLAERAAAQMARWAAGYVAHTSAYHLTRGPAYGPAGRPRPRGTARLLAGWLRWLLDLEAEPVRQATVRARTPRPTSSWPANATGGSAGGPPSSCLLAAAVVLAAITLLAARRPPLVRPGPADRRPGSGRGASGPAAAGAGRGRPSGGPPHQRDGGPGPERARPGRDQPGAGQDPKGHRVRLADPPRRPRAGGPTSTCRPG